MAFITPIDRINSLDQLNTRNSTVDSSKRGEGFQDIFSNLIESARGTDFNTSEKGYLLASGQVDDVHTVPIEAQKAQLSLDLLVQLRNKALESYNELSRISL